MSITLNNATVWAGATGDTAGTLTYSHTVNAGSGRYLVVGFGLNNQVTSVDSTVTYNGVSMTRLGDVVQGLYLAGGFYGLANPATGANNVVIDYDGTGPVNASSVAVCYDGVDADGTPIGTPAIAQSSSGDPSVNVSSATGELVVAALIGQDTNVIGTSLGAGQTSRGLGYASGTMVDSTTCVCEEDGATTVTMSSAMGTSGTWIAIGVSLKPASGGVTPTMMGQACL